MIIIGGGHNALVSAAYLAKHGLDVLVLVRAQRNPSVAEADQYVQPEVTLTECNSVIP